MFEMSIGFADDIEMHPHDPLHHESNVRSFEYKSSLCFNNLPAGRYNVLRVWFNEQLIGVWSMTETASISTAEDTITVNLTPLRWENILLATAGLMRQASI